VSNDLVNYEQAYADAARMYAEQDRASGEALSISTRAGVLSFRDNALPGNQLACVILDSVLTNTFFLGRFDPNNVEPPRCYAFTRGNADDMRPHLESMSAAKDFFIPQNLQPDGTIGGCKTCPQNQYGSADTGKGKACKNQYVLTIVPAGMYSPARNARDWELDVYDTEEHYASVDAVKIKVPVTSGKRFEDYRRMVRNNHGRAPFGVFTRIWLAPDPRSQFVMNFDFIDLAPNHLAPVLFRRNGEIINAPFEGYKKPEPKENQPAGFIRR